LKLIDWLREEQVTVEAYLLPAGVDMEFEGLLKEEKEEESSMLQQYRLLGSLIKLGSGGCACTMRCWR
jgi:hypothetical protein